MTTSWADVVRKSSARTRITGESAKSEEAKVRRRESKAKVRKEESKTDEAIMARKSRIESSQDAKMTVMKTKQGAEGKMAMVESKIATTKVAESKVAESKATDIEEVKLDERPVCSLYTTGGCHFGKQCGNRHPTPPVKQLVLAGLPWFLSEEKKKEFTALDIDLTKFEVLGCRCENGRVTGQEILDGTLELKCPIAMVQCRAIKPIRELMKDMNIKSVEDDEFECRICYRKLLRNASKDEWWCDNGCEDRLCEFWINNGIGRMKPLYDDRLYMKNGCVPFFIDAMKNRMKIVEVFDAMAMTYELTKLMMMYIDEPFFFNLP